MRIALVLGLLAGCSIYSGDDAPIDPGVDAGEPVETCEASPDRNNSCRNICRADVELCDGADWTVCLTECRHGEALVAWCPGQSR